MADFVEAKLTNNLEADIAKFEADVKEKVMFSGVAAMAKVIYDEAKVHVPVGEDAHIFYGKNSKNGGTKYLFYPGNLRDSIYRVYSKDRSTDVRKTYQISWNHTKAPYGFMVEFGTSRAPASPFMRPAFDRVNDAIEAGKQRMSQRLGEVSVGAKDDS